MSGSEHDVLVLVVETHARSWQSLRDSKSFKASALHPQDFVSQVSTFVNTYQLLSEVHRLAVVAVRDGGAPVLYSDLHLVLNPNSDAPATPAAQVVSEKLTAYLAEAEQVGATHDARPGCMSAALSKALCMLSRTCSQRRGGAVAAPRILVLHACGDASNQYIACMNAIFSAQRLNITIDGVAIAERTSSFIQQATHMTGGLYLRPRSPSALLQYLYTAFSVDANSRKFLALPASQGIDFKATCFCHANVISIGFVCSVCLSVFCKPQAECSTCGTQFPNTRTNSIAA